MCNDNDATVEGSGAIAQDGSSAAGPHGVSAGRDIRDSLIITGDSNKVTVILRGKNLRDEELLYLDGLLKQYAYWKDHYTPLAGIAEVRPTVTAGPQLSVPGFFMPQELIVWGQHARTSLEGEQASTAPLSLGR